MSRTQAFRLSGFALGAIVTLVAVLVLLGPPDDVRRAHADGLAVAPVYVGATSATFPSAGGYAAFNAACETEFPDSRMCADSWVAHTFPAPVPTTDTLVLTTVTGVRENVHYSAAGPAVESGSVNAADMNCSQSTGMFSSTDSYDKLLYIDDTGELKWTGCGNTSALYAIACCGL